MILIRDVMPCRLVDGINTLDESAASIFREEVSLMDKVEI
jgi:hypothetical protein